MFTGIDDVDRASMNRAYGDGRGPDRADDLVPASARGVAPGRGTGPWATDLLREPHYAPDDRVAERFALLEDQLRSPDRSRRRERSIRAVCS
ncbi:hypothetical protein ACFV1C_27865 [Streptomyces sp. NPDC059605]|uniref:hypothetical protein n=1 Tax=unclassified Streptomyces TaxID=2593676 RepID=UPI0036C6EEA0